MFRLDHIGDCTMFTSAARAIREYYKDRKMTVVCLSISAPIFERMGIFDKIIPVGFRPADIQFDELDKVIKEIRTKEYDILLQPQVSKFPLADILCAATKCNKRISMETKPGNSKEEWINKVNFIYDELIPYPRGVVSEFDYYGAFVRGIGVNGYRTTCPCLEYKQQNRIEGDYYVVYPGGSIRQKFWPPERMASIVNHIYEKTGLLAVFLGVESEKWTVERLKERLTPVAAFSVVDLVGYTSVFDVIDIIGNAKFILTNDTSGVHIACATQTPSVVILGGPQYKRFLPYHIENIKPEDKLPLVANVEMDCYYCDWDWNNIEKLNTECLNNMKREEPCVCIEKITVDQVKKLVDKILKEEEIC
ncbi:MAG: glycosyltransferase family 9 protein [Oscillospiraceae bacterium]|nr:glycosyltransferase family 9 protein [Oscillospiraceae bacterium]